MAHRRLLVLVLVALSGCRIDPSPGPPFSASNRIDGPDAPENESTGGREAGSGTASGGRAGSPSATPDAGGADDEPEPGACDTQTVALDEVRSGAVLPGVSVALVATATSQKFLVSQTQEGSCLWGAFVGAEPVANEPRGVLVVSYGDPASGDGRCEPGTDAILDDLAPGDSIRVVGRAASFVPSSCNGIVAAPQMIADARCPVERLAHGEPPEPVVLPLDVASDLARGSDPELVARWSGGLVRIEDVSALPNETGEGAVRPYGVVALAETDLEIHADIEYGDLSAGGPRDPAKALDLDYPAVFRSVTGLVYLDYCDYALAPRRRCTDFDPPEGCP